MEKFTRTDENITENYILVGISADTDENRSLDELEALLDTAGAKAVCKVTQRLDYPDPATYVGSGKAHEIKSLVYLHDATGVICDDELSPAQIRNLTDILEVKVIDRTILILDIFASHATTNEGKIQVEMAQQKYRLSHLHGLGKELSRQGGGIGTRGPGETKLESDRRRIQKRISILSGSIARMKKVRETNRKKRQNEGIPVVAVIGYTNAGKSTLLNRLTGAGVLAEDMLFATLDPTTRICRLSSGQNILMTDTVGFINKLPHNLIDAFRSTLEEVRYADILLHVVDVSDPDAEAHMKTVYETLDELNAANKPVITLLNKIDKLNDNSREASRFIKDIKAGHTLCVSAFTGEGAIDVLDEIEKVLREDRIFVQMSFSYSKTGDVEALRRNANIVSEDYRESDILIEAYIPRAYLGKYDKNIISDGKNLL
ncbi:MAG: GTPase HflX [Lachnospiraceae bacterium]|nr:GTPase HflX [Lachnospiraceae bacterium]